MNFFQWFYTIKRFRSLFWRIAILFFIYQVYFAIVSSSVKTLPYFYDSIVALILIILAIVFIGGYIYTLGSKKQ